MSEPRYLIWSEEHGAWWSPARMGYTRSLAEAGHYSKEEALEIVEQANRYLSQDSGRLYNEVAFPDPFFEGTVL